MAEKKNMSFAILIVWREGKDHIMDSYFCIINLKVINCKIKYYVQYLNVPSAIRPIPHSLDLPVHGLDGNLEYSSDSEHSDMTVVAEDDAYKPEEDDHAELNDLS